MEDYEKKYKEALENMRRFRDALNNHEETDLWVLKKEIVTDIEYYFPELKNKDEKIRNRILLSLEKDLMATKNSGCNTQDLEQCIAWLKKQGTQVKLSEEEQNSFAKGVLSNCALSFINYLDAHSYEGKMCVSNGECEDIDYAFHNAMWDRLHRYYCKYIEKQGEQKPVLDFKASNWYVSKVDGKIHDMTYNPTNKIEPKFKVGDWVVNRFGDVWHIDSFDSKNYQVSNENKYCYFPIEKQNEMHLWTIKDAKDGDVFVDKSDGTIGIFESIGHHPDGGSFNDPSYCFLHCRYDDGFFYADFEDGNIMDSYDAIPATKEQRDLLFQEMKEAGYEWDAEKKELKLLITNGGDFEQKKEWSEENKNVLEDIKEAVINYWHGDTQDILLDWLKSLKDKIKEK